MAYKQVILVREDLRLPKGKLAVVSSHASVECVLKSDRKIVASWRKEGAKKIVLRVKDLNELLKYEDMANSEGVKSALISDAGKTVLAPGTIACLCIGPDTDSKIDNMTGKLRMV